MSHQAERRTVWKLGGYPPRWQMQSVIQSVSHAMVEESEGMAELASEYCYLQENIDDKEYDRHYHSKTLNFLPAKTVAEVEPREGDLLRIESRERHFSQPYPVLRSVITWTPPTYTFLFIHLAWLQSAINCKEKCSVPPSHVWTFPKVCPRPFSLSDGFDLIIFSHNQVNAFCP